MSTTLQERIEMIKIRYDPDEVVEVLEITTEELMDVFGEKVLDKWDRFDHLDDDVFNY